MKCDNDTHFNLIYLYFCLVSFHHKYSWHKVFSNIALPWSKFWILFKDVQWENIPQSSTSLDVELFCWESLASTSTCTVSAFKIKSLHLKTLIVIIGKFYIWKIKNIIIFCQTSTITEVQLIWTLHIAY